MLQVEAPAKSRELKRVRLECKLAIVGGGMAGTCCAITAARAGVRVVLIQDRPVLGGNASSEVRLWILGATSHMGNNNRWAREGGVIDEILVENLYRNPEGNPLIFDTILLEKVTSEPNITLLLNTVLFQAEKSDPETIQAVHAICSQNSTHYEVHAPLFCDASGDGVLGFLAGAAFRMGAESHAEFGEKLAPTQEYGELLGHSIYFYSKDVGKPVRFVPPSFALDDITRIPRYRSFNAGEFGCRLWWIEYGGRLDTVHDTETIKWELWKIAYGVWNYIKNSGKFPEAKTLTLEWVGHLPGKRESRRFEGDYILRQQDLVEQRQHQDAVSFGGWALDLHPADGIYSEKPGCNQWHARGVYQIPYRCFYSRNIRNLFLAGRIFSASHVAFSSTRVQATLASAAQAVGIAAALCLKEGLLPADLARAPHIAQLQRELLRRGQFIPNVPLDDPDNLARQARIEASSTLRLASLPPNGPLVSLEKSWAQLLPVQPGPMPGLSFWLDVSQSTSLRVELRTSNRPENHTPDVVLDVQEIALQAGQGQRISIQFETALDTARYVFVCLMKNPAVAVRTSETRVTGILSVCNTQNPAVSNYGKQEPGTDIGIESFEFWTPLRRPGGQNLAFELDRPLELFGANNIINGWARPTFGPNAWVAEFADDAPCLALRWDSPQTLARIDLTFDTDYDHPLESVLMGHPESVIPFCMKHYRVRDERGRILAEVNDNHQSRNVLRFEPPLMVSGVQLDVLDTQGDTPAALFDVRCYATDDRVLSQTTLAGRTEHPLEQKIHERSWIIQQEHQTNAGAKNSI